MGPYYLFVIFIFCLALLFLVALKYLWSKKPKDDEQNKDEKLLRLYRQIEDMMESFETYVSEVKEEIENEKKRSLGEMQKHYDGFAHQIEVAVQPEASAKKEARHVKAVKPADKLSRSDQIRKMYEEGTSLADIAKTFNMTLSEIKLIIDVKH